jgi:hypothetical protein
VVHGANIYVIVKNEKKSNGENVVNPSNQGLVYNVEKISRGDSSEINAEVEIKSRGIRIGGEAGYMW